METNAKASAGSQTQIPSKPGIPNLIFHTKGKILGLFGLQGRGKQ
jgi:hypothetical protein